MELAYDSAKGEIFVVNQGATTINGSYLRERRLRLGRLRHDELGRRDDTAGRLPQRHRLRPRQGRALRRQRREDPVRHQRLQHGDRHQSLSSPTRPTRSSPPSLWGRSRMASPTILPRPSSSLPVHGSTTVAAASRSSRTRPTRSSRPYPGRRGCSRLRLRQGGALCRDSAIRRTAPR